MSQITTHILDTARGCPAPGVAVSLHRISDTGERRQLTETITNSDGRAGNLLSREVVLEAGAYCLHFDTAAYFEGLGLEAFYPFVEVVFRIDAGGQHYHVPLLLSPFGYSTYRGS